MFRRKNKFFQDLDYLTEMDIRDNKVTYDKLVKVSEYFNKDPILSYSIILKQREDLDNETKHQIENLIEKKKLEEQKRLDIYLQNMEPKNYDNIN